MESTHFTPRATNDTGNEKSQPQMQEHIKLPYPYCLGEQVGFKTALRPISNTGNQHKDTYAEDDGPLFPRLWKANVDHIADQKKTNKDAVPNDRSYVAIAINKISGYLNQVHYIPEAQHSKC